MILGGPFVPLWGFIIPRSDLGGVFTHQNRVRDTLEVAHKINIVLRRSKSAHTRFVHSRGEFGLCLKSHVLDSGRDLVILIQLG